MPSYVITGANRGIGFEFVKQLSARMDNTVFGIVRNKTSSKGLLSFQSGKNNVHVLEGDLADPKSLKDAASEVAKVTGGTLDVLINNASFVPPNLGYPLDGYPEGQESQLEQDYVEIFKVNVVGTIHATNAFLPLIRAASTKTGGPTPKVITLSSGVADPEASIPSGWPLGAAYTVSKAAQNSVVAKYAATYLDANIIFLAISPGLVNTATEPPTPEVLEQVMGMFAAFKRATPHWDGKPISPEESVSKMLDVFDKLTKKDNGGFLSHLGNKQWI